MSSSRFHQRFTAGLPRSYWFLWAGLLITRAGSFIVPLMTVYLTRERGLSLVEAGGVVSLYGVGSIAGTTAGGWLADHVGRRATLLFSLGASSAVMIATGFARDVPAIAACVFTLGLTTDLFRPASQAAVTDLVSPEARVRAFGAQYWALNLGFSCAALVGGFMARGGFAVLFFADAATTLVCAALIFVGVPETRPAQVPGQVGSLLTPFLDLAFLPFLVCSYVVAFVFMQHLTTLPADMARSQLGPEAFGVALATNGVLIVLLQPLVLQWVTQRSQRAVLALGSIMTGLGFGATAFATSLPGFMLTVAVWTLGEIVMAPVNSTVVAELSPTHLRGRYQSAFGLTWSLAMVTAPVLSPRVIAVTGFPVFWGLCLLACAVAAAGFFVGARAPHAHRA